MLRFLDWPEDALHEVAVKLMADETALGTGDANAKVCKLFVTIHKSVVDMSAKMFAQHRRRNYVTPTSYLDFGKGLAFTQLILNLMMCVSSVFIRSGHYVVIYMVFLSSIDVSETTVSYWLFYLRYL